jgi:pimeloyl-ACP methyl ester carboxylesterase
MASEPREPDRTVEAEGRTVAYSAFGAPGGAAVLALHGTPGSRHLWSRFDDVAAERGVRILAPDRPGYGRSEPWPDRSLADTGTFLSAVLDDAGVGRCPVLGFSGGGPHAFAFARSHPERVASVEALAGAVPPRFRSSAHPAIRLAEALSARAPRLLGAVVGVQNRLATHLPPERVAAQFVSGDLPPAAVCEHVAADFREAFARHREGYVTETRLLAGWEPDLSGLEAHVRFRHGSADTNVSMADARAFARGLGASFTAMEGADHLRTLLWGTPDVLDACSGGVSGRRSTPREGRERQT